MGYKIHLTETCTTLPDADADAGTGVMPNLITDVHTTDATVPDVKATAPIQRKLAEHGVKPGEHHLDSGYPSADLITKALKQGIRMVTPSSWTTPPGPRPPKASTRTPSPSTGRPARSAAPPAGPAPTGTR
jgi:hypothetical protein